MTNYIILINCLIFFSIFVFIFLIVKVFEYLHDIKIIIDHFSKLSIFLCEHTLLGYKSSLTILCEHIHIRIKSHEVFTVLYCAFNISAHLFKSKYYSK